MKEAFRVGIAARFADAYPDARGHRQRRRADRHGVLADSLAQPFGHGAKRFARAARENDEKLFAAVAADGVVSAQDRADSPGGFAQDRVAGGMPVAIVDALEVIEVAQDDAEGTAV